MAKPNILLLVMDSVRAKNVPLYGYDRNTTPFLREFADQATVHHQARAPGRWSLPSHASLFTGMHVVEHRLFDEGRRLRPSNTIFSELSEEHGYNTGIFSYNGYINGQTDTGLSTDFDVVEGYREPLFEEAFNPIGFRDKKWEFLRECIQNDYPARSFVNGVLMKLAWDHPDRLPDWVRRNTSAGSTPDDVYVDLFLDWEDEREGPWAACLNFMETHNEFLPDDEHNLWGGKEELKLQRSLKYGNWEYLGEQRPLSELRRFEQLYDGAIHQVDSYIKRIIRTLKERGSLENTLVVITGDHGEGFGEPDEIRPELPIVQHVAGSHECLMHVPLVVKFPGQTDRIDVTNVSSLTRFAEVVHATVAGTPTPGKGFCPPDGRVLASTHGLNEVNWNRMEEYCDGDTRKFEGETLMLYEDTPSGTVKKSIVWNDEYLTLEVPDAQTTREIGEDNREAVHKAFAELEEREVIDREGDAWEVDDVTERHLEALGYR